MTPPRRSERVAKVYAEQGQPADGAGASQASGVGGGVFPSHCRSASGVKHETKARRHVGQLTGTASTLDKRDFALSSILSRVDLVTLS